jgi:hypothetical protein
MRTGGKWTLQKFYEEIPHHVFFNPRETFQVFGRGLPQPPDLQNPAFAEIFRRLLVHGAIRGGDATVIKAFERGWVHSEINEDNVYYVFPSPLHASYLSWKLLPHESRCPFNSLVDFVLAVVKLFKPSQLRSPNNIGVACVQRPVEARYQDEFYRAAHCVTHGGITITPEYSAWTSPEEGRIDFFIPDKKWGIEILREGTNVNSHYMRFHEDGAYGQWLSGGDMTDFVVLDFRTGQLQKCHPGGCLYFPL